MLGSIRISSAIVFVTIWFLPNSTALDRVASEEGAIESIEVEPRSSDSEDFFEKALDGRTGPIRQVVKRIWEELVKVRAASVLVREELGEMEKVGMLSDVGADDPMKSAIEGLWDLNERFIEKLNEILNFSPEVTQNGRLLELLKELKEVKNGIAEVFSRADFAAGKLLSDMTKSPLIIKVLEDVKKSFTENENLTVHDKYDVIHTHVENNVGVDIPKDETVRSLSEKILMILSLNDVARELETKLIWNPIFGGKLMEFLINFDEKKMLLRNDTDVIEASEVFRDRFSTFFEILSSNPIERNLESFKTRLKEMLKGYYGMFEHLESLLEDSVVDEGETIKKVKNAITEATTKLKSVDQEDGGKWGEALFTEIKPITRRLVEIDGDDDNLEDQFKESLIGSDIEFQMVLHSIIEDLALQDVEVLNNITMKLKDMLLKLKASLPDVTEKFADLASDLRELADSFWNSLKTVSDWGRVLKFEDFDEVIREIQRYPGVSKILSVEDLSGNTASDVSSSGTGFLPPRTGILTILDEEASGTSEGQTSESDNESSGLIEILTSLSENLHEMSQGSVVARSVSLTFRSVTPKKIKLIEILPTLEDLFSKRFSFLRDVEVRWKARFGENPRFIDFLKLTELNQREESFLESLSALKGDIDRMEVPKKIVSKLRKLLASGENYIGDFKKLARKARVVNLPVRTPMTVMVADEVVRDTKMEIEEAFGGKGTDPDLYNNIEQILNQAS